MPELSGKEQANDVRRMFNHLAKRYDLANHWMTWGQDRKWRAEVIDLARLPDSGKLLDLGTGTGDLAFEAKRRAGQLLTVGADFSLEMMQVGRIRVGGEGVCWMNADALNLPFPAGSFDAVVSGYLLRNVSDVNQALAEQYRVLKGGCRMVCLDTTPPPADFWHLPARLYLQLIIPIIGGSISGDYHAYQYLSQSTRRFLQAEELASRMQMAGFKEVKYRCFMVGTLAIHSGIK